MDGVLIYPVKNEGETEATERKFICKTYALGKVLQHLGVTITELLDGGYLDAKSNAGDFMSTVMLFMFHSAEFAAQKDGKPVDFTISNCYDWVDNDGGTSGELYSKFSAIAFQNLGFKPAKEGEEPKPEKKSKVKASIGRKS